MTSRWVLAVRQPHPEFAGACAPRSRHAYRLRCLRGAGPYTPGPRFAAHHWGLWLALGPRRFIMIILVSERLGAKVWATSITFVSVAFQ